MKIQCDVCQKEEATVFCAADEAALCRDCDQRVHHANKLAGKHHRFSLQNVKDDSRGPLCDICQERRAFLFCKEDRAILCRECDIPIHTANEHTRKHTRFLLTGVKLSASSSIYSSSDDEPADSSGQDWRSSSSSHDVINHHHYANRTATTARSRPLDVSPCSDLMMMNGTNTTPCFRQSNLSPSSNGGGGYYYNNNQQVVGSDHEGSISTTNNNDYYYNYNNLTSNTDYYTTSSCDMVPSSGGWNDVVVDGLFDSSSHFFGYDHKNVAESAHCQW